MSNRFYQKFYLQCGQCRAVQRSAQGYRPLANPILFNSDDQCRNYHQEQRRAASYSGMRVTCRCDKCTRVHSNWRVLDGQQFLDHKLSLTPEERSKQLWS
ncbi:hypothetical protein STCU_03552 [Strigomonas culicis]|uniref:Uncharacterized protein n=1 Tax=Strigomonas culicis TaxID=28005 RepID=S9UK89_9TRYP|nr:hypothetical protein STCU_03566 [Strigomonas culicis]EPY31242.1 hypothetical protein STCU_03552 [Strigomonas culicis]|eukprot:EPY31214.1 hypothetical protein STCU_03566 [Strigomonas culicis]